MTREPLQIEMSLEEGTPSGTIRLASVNVRGIAYKIPRIHLTQFIKTLVMERDESYAQKRPPQDTFLDRACVYILIGKNVEKDVGKEGYAYIGQSDTIATRLRTHDAKKDWWHEVIILHRSDRIFGKGDIESCEKQLLDIAKQCNRYALDNDKSARQNVTDINRMSAVNAFVRDAKMLVELLGCTIFTPLREIPVVQPSMTEAPRILPPVFQLKTRDGSVIAKGTPTHDGFVVFAGAKISPTESDSCFDSVRKRRERLQQDGAVDADWVLRDDFLFGSPNMAANAILGRMDAGKKAWKTEEGQTLAEWEDDQNAD